MAIKQFNARINMKRDTAANWEQNNPVLLNGEIIIVDTASGEVRFKVGDGTKLYKQLPFSDEAVRALISAKEDKISLTENRAVISDASGKLSVSDVTSTELSYLDGVSSNVQTQLNKKVPTTRKINSKPLSSDITLSASDVNAVPTTRKINGKALSADITLSATDVNALPSSTTIPSKTSQLTNDSNFVTQTTLNTGLNGKVDKVSGKGLSTNDLTDTLKANYDAAYNYSISTHAPTDAEKNVIVGIQKNGTDLSVNSSTRKVNITVPTSASDVGAVPTSRKINGKTLSSDITLNASDVSALPSSTPIITYDSLLPVEATTPINADTLNGHGSDYFATDTDVSGLQTNVNDLQTNVNGLQTDVNDLQSSVSTIMSDKLSKSGGTMTGALVAQNNENYTTAQVRNVIISPAEPSGGNNGDIWLQYSE